MKPIIGIAANERPMIEEAEHWLSYTPKNFVTHIQQAQGIPLLLPMGVVEDAATYISKIDKLLLAGGHDVSPVHYGEDPHPLIQGIHPDRDVFELALIKEAVAQNKPIFGICRGMQLLNVAFGGSLYQDLFDRSPNDQTRAIADVLSIPYTSGKNQGRQSFGCSFRHNLSRQFFSSPSGQNSCG